MAIADHIIVMNEGRVQDEGRPEEIYLRPKNRFTAAFMGEANFVAGTVKVVTDAGLTVATVFGEHELPADVLVCGQVATGDAVELCFRPEHLRAGEADGPLLDLGRGRIRDIAFFGTHHRCRVEPEQAVGTPLVVHLPQAAGAVEEGIALKLATNDVIVLPA